MDVALIESEEAAKVIAGMIPIVILAAIRTEGDYLRAAGEADRIGKSR